MAKLCAIVSGNNTTAVTDDSVLEFYVVADGTTGWINIDDFSYVNA